MKKVYNLGPSTKKIGKEQSTEEFFFTCETKDRQPMYVQT